MSEVANIYDNGPISLIARIKDTISVFTQKKWAHFQVTYAEPWPRSTPLRVDLVALANLTALAANTSIAKQLVPILQVSDGELLHIRFLPLDDVEGAVWEQSGTGKFVSRNTHARVNKASGLHDPYLAMSTLFVMGETRDMNLEAHNPNPVALPQARFQFWGFRYVISKIIPDLSSIGDEKERERIIRDLALGDKKTVALYIGPTIWLPAEGV